MQSKKCTYCNQEIIGKRNDAKFCSNTCKAKHWEEKKSPQNKAVPSVVDNLRGILQPTDETKGENKMENNSSIDNNFPKRQEVNLERIALESEYKRLIDVKTKLVEQIRLLQNKSAQLTSNGNGIVLTTLGIGALLGNNVAEEKQVGTFIGGLSGFLAGLIIRDAFSTPQSPKAKFLLLELENEIKDKLSQLQIIDQKLIDLKNNLDKIPAQIKKEIQLQLPSKAEIYKLLGLDVSPTEATSRLDNDVSIKDISSDKIINSQDLSNMKFKALNFQGEWLNFFGYPSINFHCVIHGMSGEGKSTFAIQFAKYLADNFGRTVYISGEEGFSKTFKDKFCNNHAVSPYLDVADLRTFDNIIQEVPQETYNFVFIDSLDNMKIDAAKMKIIRAHYKNSALITISQATKNGKMRGSYEIVHDSDIEVDVVKGIAETNKNRFKEKGMIFEVFKLK